MISTLKTFLKEWKEIGADCTVADLIGRLTEEEINQLEQFTGVVGYYLK